MVAYHDLDAIVTNRDFSDFTGSRGFATIFDPGPVEVKVKNAPKKQAVLALKHAKEFEQLKAWGLRKK